MLRKAFFIRAMKKTTPITFAIIGAGMVGTAMAVLLQKAGHRIAAVSDPRAASIKRAVKFLGPVAKVKTSALAPKAECFLITTPDGLIQSACAELSSNPAVSGRYVFHVSGAGGLDLLASANKAGAYVGCIHPLQSFSSIEGAVESLPGSYFGMTVARGAKTVAGRLVSDFKGIPLRIRADQKPLYHAAACIASNYFVCLMSCVETLCRACGIPEEDARKAFLPLVSGSMKNIQQHGAVQALTGPVARGDLETLQKHILALTDCAPEYLPMYRLLGDLTTKLALQKKTITAGQAKTISHFFKRSNV